MKVLAMTGPHDIADLTGAGLTDDQLANVQANASRLVGEFEAAKKTKYEVNMNDGHGWVGRAG
jgi:hypothetical protein